MPAGVLVKATNPSYRNGVSAEGQNIAYPSSTEFVGELKSFHKSSGKTKRFNSSLYYSSFINS